MVVRKGAMAFLLAVGAVLIASWSPVSATRLWMTEAEMRSAFIGRTLDGHYGSGLTWTETYLAEGRLDYREPTRRALGTWYFRGNVFCTFYEPRFHPQLVGGCWTTVQKGANCYEFFTAPLRADEPGREGDDREDDGHWNARAWRQGEPSTCEDKPSV